MAPTWSKAVALALAVVSVACASSSSSSSDEEETQRGVMAYPAGEARISRTCFSLGYGDPFTCGWYCAHAFYVETDPDGQVRFTSFGEGNDADNALCSDCSLFEGIGQAPNLKQAGGVASGTLNGGYKWSAFYDAANQEMNVNFTDHEEPCEIKYVITEGKVMGVKAADGRPAKANTKATLKKVAHGGWKRACETLQLECVNWHVYVEGDVADWQSLDEADTQTLCAARITVLGMSNGEYMGHESTPRGVDSWESSDGSQIVSDRNTLVSWQPVNLTKCLFYYEVTDGCFNEVGPDCHGVARLRHEESLLTLEQRIAHVRERRLAKKKKTHQHVKQHAHAGQLPLAKPRHVSSAAWNKAMEHSAADFATPSSSSSSWAELLARHLSAYAGWGLAALVLAVWAVRRAGYCARDAGGGGYKLIPLRTEAAPLIAA